MTQILFNPCRVVTAWLQFRQWESWCEIAVLDSFAPPGLDNVGSRIPGFALAHPGLFSPAPCRGGAPASPMAPEGPKRHSRGVSNANPRDEDPNKQCALEGRQREGVRVSCAPGSVSESQHRLEMQASGVFTPGCSVGSLEDPQGRSAENPLLSPLSESQLTAEQGFTRRSARGDVAA